MEGCMGDYNYNKVLSSITLGAGLEEPAVRLAAGPGQRHAAPGPPAALRLRIRRHHSGGALSRSPAFETIN